LSEQIANVSVFVTQYEGKLYTDSKKYIQSTEM